ncbi:SRPBCC family protein [Lacisediminihabitans profunda]|uniref:SRPBCC domain-containing protein n=1 Tax=Lacisediminihabitans profunda TaxID=2594790 RepID=A0A5C8ULH5_9MICO|nr:SRPBCC domain-containing protein [Lacisediminihabitans profunda]TXN29182.1 SRPBCC domain-containing protein [Lacisediminihabitans profunda]
MTDGITITRTFAAPRDLVYSMWTLPEHFAVWFGTDAVEIPLDSVAMNVTVGGEWRATMNLPDGNSINWVGEYVEVEPPSRLAFTMTDNPSNPAREPVTVTLVEVDGGTEMTLTQNGGNLTEEQYAQTIVGYNAFFDVMERLLAERV